MTSDGNRAIVAASYGGNFSQQLTILFVSLLVGATALTLAMAYLKRLQDPMKETNQSERRDSRALRKENAMPMWAQLAAMRAGLETTLRSYLKRYHTTLRHARPEDQSPSAILSAAITRRQTAEATKIPRRSEVEV